MGFFSGSVVASALAVVTFSAAQAHGVELDLPKTDVLVKLELPDELRFPQDIDLPDRLSDFRPNRGPVVVYLDGDGGRVEAGRDHASKRRSGVVERNAMTHVDVPAYSGSSTQWKQFVGCVEDHFSEFDVVIVDERPEGRDYMTVMVGGDPELFGFEKTVGGIAPYDGSVLRDAYIFVFETPHHSTRIMCETTAHEIGHGMGLDHTRECTDLMSYERCGNKEFRDEPALCGEWSDRACADGEQTQNSWSQLAGNVGVHDHDHDH